MHRAGILVTDRAGRIVGVSANVCRKFGLPPEWFFERRIGEIVFMYRDDVMFGMVHSVSIVREGWRMIQYGAWQYYIATDANRTFYDVPLREALRRTLRRKHGPEPPLMPEQPQPTIPRQYRRYCVHQFN